MLLLDDTAQPGRPRGHHYRAVGYKHEPHVVGKMAAHIVLPWVHRVVSNLKTWGLGVYHGLRRQHLQSYLDEFVFRSTAASRPMPPSGPCSASASPSNPSPTRC